MLLIHHSLNLNLLCISSISNHCQRQKSKINSVQLYIPSPRVHPIKQNGVCAYFNTVINVRHSLNSHLVPLYLAEIRTGSSKIELSRILQPSTLPVYPLPLQVYYKAKK